MFEKLVGIIEGLLHHHDRIHILEEKIDTMAATLTDLNAAIVAVPDATATAVVAAVKAIPTTDTTDFQPQVDALAAIPAAAAAAVTTALTPPPPAPTA